MTGRQLVRIAIVLAAAVVLWGVAAMLGRGGGELERVELLRGVDTAEVDTVEIARADDTVRLVRSAAGAWTVNRFDASSEAVQELLQLIAEPIAGELAALSPSSHPRLGVDTASGKRLRVVRGDRVVGALIVGTQGRQFRTVYARRPSEDRAYLVREPLASLVDRTLTEWRDKRVVTTEPERLEQVSVERGPDRYTLVRSDGTWAFDDGAAADSAAVREWLDELRDITAQGSAFATPAELDSLDFTRPERRLTLVQTGHDTLAVLLLDSIASGFWAQREAGGPVYRLYTWRVDELTPADSTLRPSRR